MPLTFCEQLIMTLIDKAVIGGLLALAAYVFNRSLQVFKGEQERQLATFTQEQNRLNEEFKARLATEMEFGKSLRLAVAELVKRVAAATHSIAWATWAARYNAAAFSSEHLDKYDAEIHLLLGEIVGTRVALAALSSPVHAKLSRLIDSLYDLDSDMGDARKLFAESRDDGIKRLAALHKAACDLDDQLLMAVTHFGDDLSGPEAH